MKLANTAVILLALSVSGGAWAQTSEKGPIAHPQAVAGPVQGSDTRPISHPQAVADPVKGSEQGPVSHSQAAKDSNSAPQAPKDSGAPKYSPGRA